MVECSSWVPFEMTPVLCSYVYFIIMIMRFIYTIRDIYVYFRYFIFMYIVVDDLLVFMLIDMYIIVLQILGNISYWFNSVEPL